MNRQHPLFSTTSLILTAILLAGLGLVVWRTGGLAFSPGRLSAQGNPSLAIEGFESHADFENQCARCHRPLETTQDVLCLECHQDIAVQIENGEGTHGVIEDVHQCAVCHLEHRGHTFDAIADATQRFDHSRTAFSLVWHQLNYQALPTSCGDCHVMQGDFVFNPESCANCHGAHDLAWTTQHALDFGLQCLGCHDGIDRMADFDHSQAALPLEGRHAALLCIECHDLREAVEPAEAFGNTPKDCVGCHAEPAAHAGLFGTECKDCHTPSDWATALVDGQPFEHFSSTGFSLTHHNLDFSGQPLSCVGCHPSEISQFSIQDCINCHTFDDPVFIQDHRLQVGDNCLDCHDGEDRMMNFNHDALFVLDGVHAETACQDCHDAGYQDTSSACVDCHAEPEIHAGFFGLECQNCHTSTAWSPALLKNHSFPIDHGRDNPETCQTCHPTVFTEYTCYGCHEHQPDEIANKHLEEGISMDELPDCTRCHPSGLKEENGD